MAKSEGNSGLYENVNVEKSGYIVRSTAGRDKKRLFLSIGMLDNFDEGAYALIVDGSLRKCESPKKKKLKHLEFVFDTYGKPLKIDIPDPLTNKGVQKILKDLFPHNKA